MIALALAAALAATPQQFDLVCTGTKTFADLAAKTSKAEAWNLSLRLDLDRGLYCIDACHDVARVTTSSTTEIVLQDSPRGSDETSTNLKLDRVSGSVSLRQRDFLNRTAVIADAACAKRAYSGLPENKF